MFVTLDSGKIFVINMCMRGDGGRGEETIFGQTTESFHIVCEHLVSLVENVMVADGTRCEVISRVIFAGKTCGRIQEPWYPEIVKNFNFENAGRARSAKTFG